METEDVPIQELERTLEALLNQEHEEGPEAESELDASKVKELAVKPPLKTMSSYDRLLQVLNSDSTPSLSPRPVRKDRVKRFSLANSPTRHAPFLSIPSLPPMETKLVRRSSVVEALEQLDEVFSTNGTPKSGQFKKHVLISEKGQSLKGSNGVKSGDFKGSNSSSMTVEDSVVSVPVNPISEVLIVDPTLDGAIEAQPEPEQPVLGLRDEEVHQLDQLLKETGFEDPETQRENEGSQGSDHEEEKQQVDETKTPETEKSGHQRNENGGQQGSDQEEERPQESGLKRPEKEKHRHHKHGKEKRHKEKRKSEKRKDKSTSSAQKKKSPSWKKRISSLRKLVKEAKKLGTDFSSSPSRQAVEITMLSAALNAAFDLRGRDPTAPLSTSFDYQRFGAICASFTKFFVDNIATWGDEDGSLTKLADELLKVAQAFVYVIEKSTEWNEKLDTISDAWLVLSQKVVLDLQVKIQEISNSSSRRVINKQRLHDLTVALSGVFPRVFESIQNDSKIEREEALIDILTLITTTLEPYPDPSIDHIVKEAKQLIKDIMELVGDRERLIQHGYFGVQRHFSKFLALIVEIADEM